LTTPIRRASVAIAALMTLLLLVGCTQSTDRRLADGYFEEITEQPFYTLPTLLPAGKPGDIVRTERLQSARDRTIAWRVLYHTTDVTGADIVVSGTVIAPTTPAPTGGRVVVGWGHPTTGAAAKCAPPNGIDPFDLIEGMSELLNAGTTISRTRRVSRSVPMPSPRTSRSMRQRLRACRWTRS
jgi:hypothetical protein